MGEVGENFFERIFKFLESKWICLSGWIYFVIGKIFLILDYSLLEKNI